MTDKQFRPFVASITDDHMRLLEEKQILLSLSGQYKKTWLDKARKVRFDFPVYAEPKSCFMAPGFVSMGAFSYTKSAIGKDIKIGRYCSIGPGVTIMPAAHPIDRVSTSGMDYATNAIHYPGFRKVAPVQKPLIATIGHDVWIAADAVIARDVKIGHGAVIGMRSIVTKDVPPYAVVAGVPAVVKKMRFPEALIERLLASEWWDLRQEDLAQFDTFNPEKFVDQVEEFKAKGGYSLFEPQKVALHELLA